MPIYEFYCSDCHTIFNFFSKTVNTTKVPQCPKCGVASLTRQMSGFAIGGRAKEDEDMADIPFDEAKMERAMTSLAGEVENINEDDPRQAAQLMRKLTDMTGMQLGSGMEEALARMEKGEDPEQIEAELGSVLEEEEPFFLPGKSAGGKAKPCGMPRRDENLYDL